MADGKKARSLSTVRARGAELRLEAIQTQIATAFHLCATAEIALGLNRAEDGRKAIERAKHALLPIRAHVNEHGHLPADSLRGLEAQISKLEEQLSP